MVRTHEHSSRRVRVHAHTTCVITWCSVDRKISDQIYSIYSKHKPLSAPAMEHTYTETDRQTERHTLTHTHTHTQTQTHHNSLIPPNNKRVHYKKRKEILRS